MRRSAGLFLVVLWWGPGAALAGLWGLKGPQAPSAGDGIKLLEREIKESDFGAAARRLAGLVQNRADPLAELEEGQGISVHSWLQGLRPDLRAKLAQQMEKEVGAAAGGALDNLRKAPKARIEEFYGIWRQFPLTDAGVAALVEGGDRACVMGDASSALALFALAGRTGWTPDPARAGSIASLRKLEAGRFAALPADLIDATRPGGARGPKPESRGAIAFDAPWYGAPQGWNQGKIFPVAVEDRVLMATWKSVTLMRDNGQVAWSSANPRAPGAYANQRADAPGPLFAPAILWDAHGRPAVIVVRQPGSLGERQFMLRALRGADGKALWTTEGVDRKTQWSYAGSPAVSGQFIYSLVIARSDFASAAIALVATDLMTGQSLWTANLGSLNVLGEPLEPGALACLPEPGIEQELAIVACNGGTVIAVDRFDGGIRWTHSYRKINTEPDHYGAGFLPRPKDASVPASRYKCAIGFSGDVVIVLPQDSPAVLGLDRTTGALKWKFEDSEVYGLAGVSGKWAVLCGPGLMGVDTTTGKRMWRQAQPGAPLTGPAAVIGETAVGPTVRGYFCVNAADGKPAAAVNTVSFRRILLTESGKAALREAGAERSFGTAAK